MGQLGYMRAPTLLASHLTPRAGWPLAVGIARMLCQRGYSTVVDRESVPLPGDPHQRTRYAPNAVIISIIVLFWVHTVLSGEWHQLWLLFVIAGRTIMFMIVVMLSCCSTDLLEYIRVRGGQSLRGANQYSVVNETDCRSPRCTLWRVLSVVCYIIIMIIIPG